MRNINPKLLTALVAGLLALSAPVPSQAQFLKKLSEGLKKVNKGLEQVNKALNDQDRDPDRKNADKKLVTDTGNGEGKQARSRQKPAMDMSGWKKVNSQLTAHPYIDGSTLYMRLNYVDVSPVQEDVFALKRNGRIEFWRVDGNKLFDADWEYCGERYNTKFPLFNGGVTAARRATPNAAGKKPICLLYLDGRVRELNPAWTSVTDFMDGLALVKQDARGDDRYFYINAAGQKVFPALAVSGNVSQESAMRPLRDGLRAYQYGRRIIGDRYENNELWGYIDDKGVPQLKGFSQARDFSEGYAWVVRTKGGELELIDTKGNTVFKPGIIPYQPIYGSRYYSDVHNGIVRLCGESHGSKVVYYTVDGRKLGEYDYGTSFYDGYAFVDERPSGSMRIDQVFLVNTGMKELKHMSDKVMPTSVLCDGLVNFEPYGLAVWRDYVSTPDGTIILSDWESKDNPWNYIRSFGQFSKSGYSFVDDIRVDNSQYKGLMTPDGHLAWLFSGDASGHEGWSDFPREPIKPIDQPTDTIPWRIIDETLPPIGPTVVTATKYNVRVKASPAEGGSASLSAAGPFGYGESVTLNASPAGEEWAVGSVSSNKSTRNVPVPGTPFAVTDDMELTVNFVKRDDETAPAHTGYYQGTIRTVGDLVLDIPVYAEISTRPDIETPYGKNTYGFLTIMADPRQRYAGKNVAANLFCTPLLICGETHDEETGKDWLILDGGSTSVGNLMVGPGNGDPWGMLMNMMLSFDGLNNVTSKPRHYRVEIKDRDKDTGEFTLGTLETYSDTGHWEPGGSREVSETTQKFFGSFTDTGYKAYTFTDTPMRKVSKRDDVDWYPTAEFFDSDSSLLESVVKAMGNTYRTSRSHYYDLFPPK